MITSARRAALSCALLATTAFCGLSAQPAAAQASQTPSIYKNIDANGVDLTDGSFNFQLMEGSIGSGSGALALMRYHGAGGQLNSLSVRFSRVVTSGTASITLTFGDRAQTFRPLGDPQEASVRAALDFLAGRQCTPIGSSVTAQSLSAVPGKRELLTPAQPSAVQGELPGSF